MKKYSYNRSKVNKELEKTVGEIKKFQWKHHNLILLLISIVAAYFILTFKPITSLIHGLSYFGYAASFVLGMLFTYALTAIPATAALYNLGENFNPFLIAFIGAFGSVISDYLIFRFVRDRLMTEIKLLSREINNLTEPLSNLVSTKRIRVVIWKKISQSRIWKTLVPVIAGFIIASPLPDEIGVAIFGAAKYEPRRFLLISYILNFIGILIVASIGNVLL
jgi:uncharacterized membrane protein YdjX (TVP38/TMEM64 family)